MIAAILRLFALRPLFSLMIFGFPLLLLVAARGRGLDTCPQAAFTQYHAIIEEQLGIPDSEMVVCGMALGYADTTKIENSLVTAREPVSGFTRYFE